jgi:C4-dicarboxylate-specific signal transduction histidine kinase
MDQLTIQIQSEPWVEANRVQLQQVLINLLKNAADAIHGIERGHITLVLSVEGEQALIEVSDNGCGMSFEVADRIWEPFFTTKDDQGTGLGLDVAKSIIEGHGGTIDCETRPAAGAKFTIRLPRLESPPKQETPAAGPVTAVPFDTLPQMPSTNVL